jgi:hypothetical protein
MTVTRTAALAARAYGVRRSEPVTA